MEKDRSTKVIAIVALCIAIVGLSVGFASFSSLLTISSSAQVSPNAEDFDVNFSTVDTAETPGNVNGQPSDVSLTTPEIATIDNTGDPKITGLKAYFTEPGQSVTYSFFAHNAGKYTAYLKSVSYENVTDSTLTKVCTAAEGTSAEMVNSACSAINVSVKIGSELVNGSTPSITKHSLAIGAYEPIEVKIEYASDGTRTDGDFSVAFGDIALTYSSVD